MESPGPAGAVDASLVARALALLDRGLAADARALLADALGWSHDPEGFAGDEPRGADPEGFAGDRSDDPEGFAGDEPRGGDPGGFGDDLHDTELESAFDDAHPETDAMIDADGIAFEAILRARLDEPESVPLPSPDSPFHTRTMADLLERQGDPASAHAIRSALDAMPSIALTDPAHRLDGAARARTIQTLERWLARLRGGDA